MAKTLCEFCGVREAVRRFCSSLCNGAWLRAHPKPPRSWRYDDASGYVMGNYCGRRISQHRYLMEQHLGRELVKGEVVHHRNGNKSDNRLENLIVVSHAEHGRLHREETRAALDAFRRAH